MGSVESGQPRAAELADAESETHWKRERLEDGTVLVGPRVASGSSEEDAALARIEELREIDRDRLGETSESRARRQASWWGRAPKYKHLGEG